LDLFPPGVFPLFFWFLIMLTIFLKSLIELMLADPSAPAFPGDWTFGPLAPRVTDFLLLAELDLMRAPTAAAFLDPPFLADLDFLVCPPETLTLPDDPPWESLLRALAPFSCLKTDSRETNAVFPSLKL
jgi:hypothetical protein